MSAIVDHHVQIAMRDGILLSADIYRPSSGTSTTVLLRSCYTKAAKTLGSNRERGAFWTASGYAYVVQDVRGRGDSDGRFYPLVYEGDDGSDTIDWIASQPWSDGRVVMIGGSYPGWTQVYAACSHNRHLVALVPMVTPPDPDRSFPMSHGMIMPAAAAWMATLDGHINQDLSALDLGRAFAARPMIDFDIAIGRHLKPWRDWVSHAVRDDYWERQAYQTRLRHCSQPMLHVSGWYDDCLIGALENFAALSERKFEGESPAQRLLIGPWLHTTVGLRRSGDIDYGEAAEIDLNQLQRKWFDACVKGEVLEQHPVRLFVMGRNAWIDEKEWPIARTEYVSYYLHSRGRANTSNGDGALSTSLAHEEPADQFRFDPTNPVPYSTSLDFSQVGGPDDCANIELRDDVLVYTGPVVREPLLICGPLRVKLFASTSARDTDWTAKILDVHPDGTAIRLNDGAVRARFRKGHDRELFLSPGAIEEYDIDCWATCIELQRGHRLRLEISSSAFGKYDVNLNGGGPVGQESEAIIARQTIYHDAVHPSRVIVPVLRS
jgi:putative CocE/NonD family hydrolase